MSDVCALEMRGLSFTYSGLSRPVLRDVSWRVPEGAFALLVGGTGSGKSTLLSLAKREIAPAGDRTGEVLVFGRSTDALSDEDAARSVGYVFQSPDNQIVCETVWHEMAFGLENLGTPQDEMRRLVAETSYFFGMDEWFHRETDTLSGGRKQLLALASTLVMQPRLLLLDEPTAQLDPIAEKNFLHALFRVNRELGCTVVVATHAPRAMVDYATCAFELVDGRLRDVGDLDAMRRREALFVDALCDQLFKVFLLQNVSQLQILLMRRTHRLLIQLAGLWIGSNLRRCHKRKLLFFDIPLALHRKGCNTVAGDLRKQRLCQSPSETAAASPFT